MRVAVAGAELECRVRGAGPVCVVLSSIGCEPYERQLPAALDRHLRMAFVELRGSASSTGEPAELDFERLSDDLEAVRVALGVEKMAVLGHSILGALALEHARRSPATVSHAILVGTPPYGDMARLAAAAQAFFAADASPARQERLRANLAALPPDAGPGQRLLASVPQRCFDPDFDLAPALAGARANPAFFAHLLGPLTHGWQALGEPAVVVPVWLALGRYDYTVPHRLWDDLAAQLPTASREVFQRSGHQPFLEEPAAFSERLLAWMSAAGPVGG